MDSTSKSKTKLMGKTRTEYTLNSLNVSYINPHLIKGNKIHFVENTFHFDMKQQHPPHKSILRVCSRFDLAVETYLYSSTYYHNRFQVTMFSLKIVTNYSSLNQKLFLFCKRNTLFIL